MLRNKAMREYWNALRMFYFQKGEIPPGSEFVIPEKDESEEFYNELKVMEAGLDKSLKRKEILVTVDDIINLQALTAEELKKYIHRTVLSAMDENQIQEMISLFFSLDFKRLNLNAIYESPDSISIVWSILDNSYRKSKLKGQRLYEKMRQSEYFFNIVAMKCLIKTILRTEGPEYLDFWHVRIIRTMYLVGKFSGYIDTVDSMGDRFFQKMIHGVSSSKAVKNIRWRKRDEDLKQLLEIAEKCWEEGDEMQHNEMATYIHTHFKKEYPNISKATLRKRLIPLAKKYGKVRGLSKNE